VKAEINCGGPVALDLEEVDLVDVEAVRFLNAREDEGIAVLHCPPYITRHSRFSTCGEIPGRVESGTRGFSERSRILDQNRSSNSRSFPRDRDRLERHRRYTMSDELDRLKEENRRLRELLADH
jgi:hypothetical protein